jgi:two-component system, chemotaxis family, CheB/CheR fusion protein
MNPKRKSARHPPQRSSVTAAEGAVEKIQITQSDVATPSRLPMIVGIGASAGGLDAFKSFFARMPHDSGMAFILIQHLNPSHKSILTELIARQTAMRVAEAEDGMGVRPNTIFIIPPDATLTIRGGVLHVTKPAPPRESRYPIDAFFNSLAEDQGENAVCIVLSGTGSDGTSGLRAIKHQGGLTMAQAGFDHIALTGMPLSAAATGLVDHLMQVDDMPAQLVEYHRHLAGVAALKNGEGARRDTGDHLQTISALLKAATGHDFELYKQNTLGRRVQRRMQVLHIDTVPQYIERLRKDHLQLDLLFREFLIGVTQFFRDPQAFEALRVTAMPMLLANEETPDQLRIWIPGCATGEEAYSIAIVLKEEMERKGAALRVQIFGTDIDDNAIAIARAGYYPKSLAGLSPEQIERWFAPRGDGYCPVKQIREMCMFSVHSVTRDPPFSKLDLISCRNLLIYLGGALQERVVRTFHYALRSGGVLMLGPSEGVTRGSKLFAAIDKRQRLFQRRDMDTPVRLPAFPAALPGPRMHPSSVSPAIIGGRDERIDKNARNVMEKYSPAFLVIDQQYEVLRFSGGEVGRYLEPAAGAPSSSVFGLLRRALRPIVRGIAQKVFSEGRSILQEQVSITIDGRNRVLTIIGEPITAGRDDAGLCVIAFQELVHVQNKRKKLADGVVGSNAEAIEEELRTAKASLLTASADLETANEEAASAGEEYQSVNEELQSSNEELETAKEEMQSINEELQTVNAELNSKNDLLIRSNSDLQNLLDSTEIATIFLDEDLRVKGYTPGMKELFHLRDADRGRPLDEIVSRLAYGDLKDDVLSVLTTLTFVEREVDIAKSGATFIMRIRPYRTIDRGIDGVVITFVDISHRKRTEETLREHASIVEFSTDALVSLTLAGVVRSWNPGAERLFGCGASEAIGRLISDVAGLDWVGEQIAAIEDAKAGKVVGPFETIAMRQDGAHLDVELTLMPILGSNDAVAALAMSARDIGERKNADTHRTLLLRELSHRVKNALATVQSIATQTLKGAPTPEAFGISFSSRLMALANTHDLLTQGEWQGATLGDVIEAELAPYQSDSNPRWRGEGPSIMLDAKTALALGMALHELATNAAKYGAFSMLSGRVEVNWERRNEEKGDRLHVSWTEVDGPRVEKPRRKGFGTRLIGDGLAYELDGQVDLDFNPEGLRCVIDVPLNAEVGE